MYKLRLLGGFNPRLKHICNKSSILPICRRNRSSTETPLPKNDSPVKFSASQASRWKAEFTRRGIAEDDMPWFQPYVVSLSVGIFLLYFCYLREENDIDEVLSVQLYDRIDGLEESQLRMSLKYNLENGRDTTAIKKRLKELEDERNRN